MQKIDLTAALKFTDHGFADQFIVFAPHKGFNRKALLRGRGNHGKVADSFKAHREGSRNGRCRERQDVHFGPQSLQPLFLPDAEPVFFVDYDEP